jgi:hypothetical protein
MLLHNARRPATARPVNEPPFDLSCGEADNARMAHNRFQTQARREIAARLRRQRHVEHLHRLGPSPLGHFITEIERGADIDASLEAYAKLDADFIKALGGDRFAPSLHCIDGGEP